MATVIIGAGIIGVSTAFYLSEQVAPSSIRLVEVSPEPFASASGKAAGFLARDWFPPESAALGALSFDLHKKLAEDFGGREKWGYSHSTGVSLLSSEDGAEVNGHDWLMRGSSRAGSATKKAVQDGEELPSWLQTREGERCRVISRGDTTAQVDPLRLCQFLLKMCLNRGVTLHHPAKALCTASDMHGELASVRILDSQTGMESDIPCTKLVITAGAWSDSVFKSLFPESKTQIPVTWLAGYSCVMRSSHWSVDAEDKECHAIFAGEDHDFAPEIFSRADGDIYVAGLNLGADEIDLPPLPTDAAPKSDLTAAMRRVAISRVRSGAEGPQVTREALCFRPLASRGIPVLAKVPDVNARPDSQGGVYVAAGHGPWGISMSLGTGKVVAEILENKNRSAGVENLGL